MPREAVMRIGETEKIAGEMIMIAQKNKKDAVNQARTDAGLIVEKAKKDGYLEKAEKIKNAGAKAERIIEDAEAQAEKEAELIREDGKAHMPEAVRFIAERIVAWQ